MTVRTTSAAVQEVLSDDYTSGDSLTAFIEAANRLVTKVCTSTDYDSTDLELIERWLAAHSYMVGRKQTSEERVDVVGVVYAVKTDLGFDSTTYGQMAMRLAWKGELGRLNVDIKKGKGGRSAQVLWGIDSRRAIFDVRRVVMGWISRLTQKAGQTAVYWEPDGKDSYGQPTFKEGREISVRWIDKAELFLDSNGEQKVSRAHVHVLEDLEIFGLLYKGNLTDLTTPNDPQRVSGAYQIRQKLGLKDVSGSQDFYKVIL